MDTQVKILRDKLNELLDKDKIILSEEILRISDELDQLTVTQFMEQVGNEFRKEA